MAIRTGMDTAMVTATDIPMITATHTRTDMAMVMRMQILITQPCPNALKSSAKSSGGSKKNPARCR